MQQHYDPSHTQQHRMMNKHQQEQSLNDEQLHELEVMAVTKAPYDRFRYQQLHDFHVAEIRHELDTAEGSRQRSRANHQHAVCGSAAEKRRKLSAEEVLSARQLIQTVLRGVNHRQVGSPGSVVGCCILDGSKAEHEFPELHFIRGCSRDEFLGFDE
ncbi:hypothetical protein HDU81_001374 [Chytriomyces hyalinus]|nr:hypothetical protein HDU81_001374 [Chytriomyces hyalinus]